jgi:hypothetical protein
MRRILCGAGDGLIDGEVVTHEQGRTRSSSFDFSVVPTFGHSCASIALLDLPLTVDDVRDPRS